MDIRKIKNTTGTQLPPGALKSVNQSAGLESRYRRLAGAIRVLIVTGIDLLAAMERDPTAFLVLRATELGLVAHPIAGFDEGAAKEILGIDDEMKLITLVIVGKHSDSINDLLTEKQAEAEMERPERLPVDDVASFIG